MPSIAGDRRGASHFVRGAVVLALLALGLASCAPAGGSSLTWTARRTVPSDGGLDAMACPSTTTCVALVGTVQSVRLEGSTWTTPVPVEQITRANAPTVVTCVRVTWCATFDGLGRVLTYNGQRWSAPVQVDSAAAGIAGISCASPDFCAIVDANGDAAIDNGTRWSTPKHVVDSSGLGAVSCPAVGVCLAIDVQSNEVFGYADGKWSISGELDLSTPQGGSEPNSLADISCGSRRFCVALDAFGEAFTYNGKWSGPHTFDGDLADGDAALSCTAELVCVIVDDDNIAVVDDNGAWSTPRQLDAKGMLLGVACAPRGRCVATDGRGGYFVGQKTKKS